MTRGFTWGDYVDDDGNEWAVAVDSDYVTDPIRGWTIAGDTGLVPLPNRWRPRRVIGLDQDGGKIVAVVAQLAADLWTGAATVFSFKDSTGTPRQATVVEYRAERRIAVRADPPEP